VRTALAGRPEAVLLGLVALGILPPTTLAQGAGSALGRITSTDERANLPNALVSITGTGLSVLTGEAGWYFIVGVPPGRHEITLELPGYFEARDIAPLFPFGHGLSYTTFGYESMRVSSQRIDDTGELVVTATIANTGEVPGKEIVQLYVSDPVSSLQRPIKELKGFTKVSLAPGESREVRFTLTDRAFSYYDPGRSRWVAESGDFEIAIGASSADIRLTETIQLRSTQRLNYAFDGFTFFRVLWEDDQTKPLLIERMPAWIGSHAAEGEPPEQAEIPDFLLDQPLLKFPYFTGGEVTRQQIDALIEQCNTMTYSP